MSNHYDGKIAVITGAGSGIGQALARQLAAAGCHLALSDVNAAGLEDTRALVGSSGVRVWCETLDVADWSAVRAYAALLEQQFGRADLLFNNAGVAGRHELFPQYGYEDFRRVIDVNLWGTVNCTYALLPLLLRSEAPQLVNVSSIFGIVGPQAASAYATSKYAVRGFSEALQRDFSDGPLAVTCVHPGLIATNLVVAAGTSQEIVDLFRTRGMSAERCAAIILGGVAKRRRRIVITPLARMLDALQRLSPAGLNRIKGRLIQAS